MSSPILDIEQILQLATLVESLPESLKEFYAKGFDVQTRRAQTNELISEISVGLVAAVSVLELRNPYAADLLKRRMAVMERDARSCCEQDIPEFTNPQNSPPRMSDGGKHAGILLVFCLTFAVSLRALATEFASPTSGQSVPTPKAKADAGTEYLIQDTCEHYVICGFGEKLTLQKSNGVERLVAVVTSPDHPLPIFYLYTIGGAERRARRSSSSGDEEQIDRDGNGISERRLPVDETDDSRFDDDTTDAVWERLRGLIEERDLARKTGNKEEAQRITKALDVLYVSEKKLVKNARDSVRNTINATIQRIDKERFPNLWEHFFRSVDLSDDKRDYVFTPAGLDIVWKISKS